MYFKELDQFIDYPDVLAGKAYYGYQYIFLNDLRFIAIIRVGKSLVEVTMFKNEYEFISYKKKFKMFYTCNIRSNGHNNFVTRTVYDGSYSKEQIIKDTKINIQHFKDTNKYKEGVMTKRVWGNMMVRFKQQEHSIGVEQYAFISDCLATLETMLYSKANNT